MVRIQCLMLYIKFLNAEDQTFILLHTHIYDGVCVHVCNIFEGTYCRKRIPNNEIHGFSALILLL